jgi:hypothetical protein
MGLFWVKENDTMSFKWGRFIGVLLLFAVLTAFGVWAEKKGVDGGAAFLYGSAGGVLVVLLGFFAGETLRH